MALKQVLGETVSESVEEATIDDPNEWDIVQTIKGFDQLLGIIKKVRKCTPRLVTEDGFGHPLDSALHIVNDCKQAALLAYGKAMWRDAHKLAKEFNEKP